MDVGSGFDIARLEIWLTWTGAIALLIVNRRRSFPDPGVSILVRVRG